MAHPQFLVSRAVVTLAVAYWQSLFNLLLKESLQPTHLKVIRVIQIGGYKRVGEYLVVEGICSGQ